MPYLQTNKQSYHKQGDVEALSTADLIDSRLRKYLGPWVHRVSGLNRKRTNVFSVDGHVLIILYSSKKRKGLPC